MRLTETGRQSVALEQAKISLSTEESADVRMQREEIDLAQEITRSEFEAAIALNPNWELPKMRLLHLRAAEGPSGRLSQRGGVRFERLPQRLIADDLLARDGAFEEVLEQQGIHAGPVAYRLVLEMSSTTARTRVA